MIGGMGGWEWGIVLVIVIIVFGVGKLPEVGGAMGKAIREFRDASAKDDDTTSTETESESKA
ncbi:twin-arginine translocase TatA/TatE family subunit [Anaerolineales bacterium HSG6]|nr:twin-arginine translocase TatA/TatE family subunit [Anaerolineales bacterium HSG6]MDM8532787.1 twin-arginine translocase TatA/TatE family subunit [Anaerolineales bacterium HSG25]